MFTPTLDRHSQGVWCMVLDRSYLKGCAPAIAGIGSVLEGFLFHPRNEQLYVCICIICLPDRYYLNTVLSE